MPYKSQAQRRFFHTETAKKNGITSEEVNEFDKSSKGLSLPEAIRKKNVEERVAKKWRGGKVK